MGREGRKQDELDNERADVRRDVADFMDELRAERAGLETTVDCADDELRRLQQGLGDLESGAGGQVIPLSRRMHPRVV